MKITLITVCRNSASVIRTALESVLAQRGAGVEYLVIDGASTDGTVEILREYEAKFRALSSAEGTSSAVTFRFVSERDAGMYDAMNKGLAMATGEVIGILNADDVLASDMTLARIAEAFDADASLDGTYADIRFVRDGAGEVGSDARAAMEAVRALPTSRYCSGRWFSPWQFRFGVQTAHPSTFFRASCFVRWGVYSLDYGMFGDFDLLLRFIWKNRARMRYLPFCTTVMRAGGASTNGWQTTRKINATDLRVIRNNGYWSCMVLLYARYIFKVWGYVLRK